MKDEDLVKYIPKFGDRITVVVFRKRPMATSKKGLETLSARHDADIN